MLIQLKNIRANPIIGVYESERNRKQPIIINVKIQFNEGDAAQTDNLDDTFDYCEFSKALVKDVNATDFQLLESLTTHILDKIMVYKSVVEASVEIDKPEALADIMDSVSLTATRTRT